MVADAGYIHLWLVGGFNPSGLTIPNIWKNKKCSKPATSILLYYMILRYTQILSGWLRDRNLKDWQACGWVGQFLFDLVCKVQVWWEALAGMMTWSSELGVRGTHPGCCLGSRRPNALRIEWPNAERPASAGRQAKDAWQPCRTCGICRCYMMLQDSKHPLSAAQQKKHFPLEDLWATQRAIFFHHVNKV